MSKGFITGTNEELIKAYKESRDESYLKELIEANKGLINLLVSPYLTSIPNSELEDLTSESYIPMLRAIEDYDPEQGVAFSTLLKVYVRQHLNRLYNEATRQKRFTGTAPDSLDRLSEINKEGGTETDSTFEVECKDFSSVEFMDLLDSLQLNDKEQVAVNILMAGGAKGEIAKALNITNATVSLLIFLLFMELTMVLKHGLCINSRKSILERIIREQTTESSIMCLEILRCLLLMFVWIWSLEV